MPAMPDHLNVGVQLLTCEVERGERSTGGDGPAS
jgi:hypothetical protein